MALSDLYYNKLDDAAREKVSIILVNGDDGRAYVNNLRSRNQRLPIAQDDPSETLFNSISNNDRAPKDDMALFDAEGRLIQYFESADAYMGNASKNNIRTAVEAVLAPGYVNPCAEDEVVAPTNPTEKKDKQKKDKGKSGRQAKNVVSKADVLNMCKVDEATCSTCKGRWRKSKCKLSKKIKCRHLLSEDICKAAGCNYRRPKNGKPMKCKGNEILG